MKNDYLQKMVTELSSGPFVAIEIACSEHSKESAYQSFRRLCGPINPVNKMRNLINGN